jgi:hypothetical protein
VLAAVGALGGASAEVDVAREPRFVALGARLYPPHLEEHDYLGDAVALGPHGLVVGAPGDDEAARNAGAVYVWERGPDGRWTVPPRKLKPSGLRTNDAFGTAVAADGDWLVVGAWQDDERGNGAGAAYVFRRGEHGGWSQSAKLTAPDGAAFDQFGGAVALREETIAVGARQHHAHGMAVGTVYVYALDGGAWRYRLSLTAPGGDGQRFGSSLALGPDVLLVGTPGDDEAGTDAGAAFLYRREGAAWKLSTKLLAHDAMTADAFGHAVALGGDVAVVTAIRQDEAAPDGGAAYVFVRAGARWTEAQKLVAFDGVPHEMFGWSVACADGTLVIGAPYDSRGADREGPFGAAYVFRARGERWTATEKLLADRPRPFDFFGWSLALEPGLLALGARLDDGGALEAGTVYVHVLDPRRSAGTGPSTGSKGGEAPGVQPGVEPRGPQGRLRVLDAAAPSDDPRGHAQAFDLAVAVEEQVDVGTALGRARTVGRARHQPRLGVQEEDDDLGPLRPDDGIDAAPVEHARGEAPQLGFTGLRRTQHADPVGEADEAAHLVAHGGRQHDRRSGEAQPGLPAVESLDHFADTECHRHADPVGVQDLPSHLTVLVPLARAERDRVRGDAVPEAGQRPCVAPDRADRLRDQSGRLPPGQVTGHAGRGRRQDLARGAASRRPRVVGGRERRGRTQGHAAGEGHDASDLQASAAKHDRSE